MCIYGLEEITTETIESSFIRVANEPDYGLALFYYEQLFEGLPDNAETLLMQTCINLTNKQRDDDASNLWNICNQDKKELLSNEAQIPIIDSIHVDDASGIDIKKKTLEKYYIGPNKKVINVIPNIAFTGSYVPLPLGGHIALSLDGFWILGSTQGNPKVIPYVSKHLNKAQYTKKSELVFIVPGFGQNRYYHAIVHSIPYLMAYKEMGLDCPIALPRFPYELQPRIREVLDAMMDYMRIPKERILSRERMFSTKFESAVAPVIHILPNKFVTDFYEDFSDHFEKDSSCHVQPEKVYISRILQDRRRIDNEDRIIELLADQGFRILELENMSFEEQFCSLRDAKTVVAPHGAGLVNTLFCRNKISMVELLTYTSPPYFKNICDSRGFEYTSIQARQSENNMWHVEEDDLNKLISSVI
ncbi:DUF563 domain-containing protein [Nitrospirota bacterium]